MSATMAPVVRRTMIDIGMEIDRLCRIIEDPEATQDELAHSEAALDSIMNLDLAEKVDAYAWVDKWLDAGVAEIKEHVDKPSDKAKAALARRKRDLRARCKNALDLMHATLIKGRVHTIYTREAEPELVLDEDFAAPDQYCTVTVTMPLTDWQRMLDVAGNDPWYIPITDVQQTVTTDAQAIKLDLKSGAVIPGARLQDKPPILVIL